MKSIQHQWIGVIIIVIMSAGICVGQQMGERDGQEGRVRHRLGMLMANSFIPAGDNINDQGNIFIVPALGLNYDYWFSRRLGAGVHTDFILQQYKIEKHDDEKVIERSFPLIVSASILYKITDRLILIGGVGRELEKHESFTVIQTGIEYGIELPQHFELSFNFVYDNKVHAYDSWLFGIGLSKVFLYRD